MIESQDVLDALHWRYACKKFDSTRHLSEQTVQQLLEALNLTATSLGMQLMKIVVVKNPIVKEQMIQHCYNQHQVVDCSHVLVLCRFNEVDEQLVDEYVERSAATRNFDLNSPKMQGFRNMVLSTISLPEEKRVNWMINQVYIALGNLLTTCAMMQIDSCPMEGFNPKGIDTLLGLPELGLSSVLLCPIGFRHADDVYAQLPKVRKPIDDFAVYLD